MGQSRPPRQSKPRAQRPGRIIPKARQGNVQHLRPLLHTHSLSHSPSASRRSWHAISSVRSPARRTGPLTCANISVLSPDRAAAKGSSSSATGPGSTGGAARLPAPRHPRLVVPARQPAGRFAPHDRPTPLDRAFSPTRSRSSADRRKSGLSPSATLSNTDRCGNRLPVLEQDRTGRAATAGPRDVPPFHRMRPRSGRSNPGRFRDRERAFPLQTDPARHRSPRAISPEGKGEPVLASGSDHRATAIKAPSPVEPPEQRQRHGHEQPSGALRVIGAVGPHQPIHSSRAASPVPVVENKAITPRSPMENAAASPARTPSGRRQARQDRVPQPGRAPHPQPSARRPLRPLSPSIADRPAARAAGRGTPTSAFTARVTGSRKGNGGGFLIPNARTSRNCPVPITQRRDGDVEKGGAVDKGRGAGEARVTKSAMGSRKRHRTAWPRPAPSTIERSAASQTTGGQVPAERGSALSFTTGGEAAQARRPPGAKGSPRPPSSRPSAAPWCRPAMAADRALKARADLLTAGSRRRLSAPAPRQIATWINPRQRRTPEVELSKRNAW